MLPIALKVRPNATAAGVGGSLAVLAVYLGSVLGWNPPAEVATAIVAIVSTVTVEWRARARNGSGTTAAPPSKPATIGRRKS